jgi:hypothetical protein
VLERRPDHATAGVVDQDVDVAQLADRGVHQVVGHARLLQLADEPTRDVNLVQDLVQILLGPRRGEHAGAVGGKPPCDTQPDAG